MRLKEVVIRLMHGEEVPELFEEEEREEYRDRITEAREIILRTGLTKPERTIIEKPREENPQVAEKYEAKPHVEEAETKIETTTGHEESHTVKTSQVETEEKREEEPSLPRLITTTTSVGELLPHVEEEKKRVETVEEHVDILDSTIIEKFIENIRRRLEEYENITIRDIDKLVEAEKELAQLGILLVKTIQETINTLNHINKLLTKIEQAKQLTKI